MLASETFGGDETAHPAAKKLASVQVGAPFMEKGAPRVLPSALRRGPSDRQDPRRRVLVGAGIAWGLVVFAVSTWIGLPLAAALFGGGDPIRDMASMVGYPTFLVEHLLFGATLGLMLLGALRSRR